jgi:hypothetical protein
MMWVRLIGGIDNGQVAKVDPDQVEHIAHKSVPMPLSRGISIGSMSSEIRRTRYTRREVHTPEGHIVFFADADISDHAALNSVLGP